MSRHPFSKDIEPMRVARKLAGLAAALAVCLLSGNVLAGGGDEASGVSTRRGDSSPSASAS